MLWLWYISVQFSSVQQALRKAVYARCASGSRVTRTKWINNYSLSEWQRTIFFYEDITLLQISFASCLHYLFWDLGAGRSVSRGQGKANRWRGFSSWPTVFLVFAACSTGFFCSAWDQLYLSPSLLVSFSWHPIRWCLNRFLWSGTPSLTDSLQHPFRGLHGESKASTSLQMGSPSTSDVRSLSRPTTEPLPVLSTSYLCCSCVLYFQQPSTAVLVSNSLIFQSLSQMTSSVQTSSWCPLIGPCWRWKANCFLQDLKIRKIDCYLKVLSDLFHLLSLFSY